MFVSSGTLRVCHRILTCTLPTSIRPERPNSVLVIGATGNFGEWISMKIMKRNINTRILARNWEKAEDMFGRDGANLDIYLGDVKDLAKVDNACEGAQAVVFAAGGGLPFGPDSYQAVGVGGVRNLCKAVGRYPTINRVILISAESDYGAGGLQADREAEEVLRSGVCPICRAPVLLPSPEMRCVPSDLAGSFGCG